MVFIVAGRPRRLAFCLLWPLLLAALCVGRNKIGFESETRPNENLAEPIVSISARRPLTSAGGTASYAVTTSKTNNFRRNGTVAQGRHYALDRKVGRVVIPAGAGSTSVTFTALNGDLPAGHRVATTMVQRGGGYRLGSVAKASGTIAGSKHQSCDSCLSSFRRSAFFNSACDGDSNSDGDAGLLADTGHLDCRPHRWITRLRHTSRPLRWQHARKT